jgi:hypothetical protein
MDSSEKIKSLKLKAGLQRNFIQYFLRNLLDGRILQPLESLITRAHELGLPEIDVENALINLDYNEPELSFEVIVEQMYEYEIKIDKEFYDSAMAICETLKLEKQKYDFLKELFDNQQ